MIKRKNYPFSTRINWAYKAYASLLAGFGLWAYVHGHLLSYAYQEKLGASRFNVPIDGTKAEIYGGIEILLDFKYLIFLAFISPALIILIEWILFLIFKGRLSTRNWWIKPSVIVPQILVYFFLLAPIVAFLIILNPINEGNKRALKLMNDPNCEQLIIGAKRDSVINCKIVYYEKDFAVFLIDDVAYGMSIPNGSQVVHDPSYIE